MEAGHNSLGSVYAKLKALDVLGSLGKDGNTENLKRALQPVTNIPQ